MADTAAHLVDRVLPEVPIRQWVLTLPYPLRYACACDAKLANAVLRAFVRALFAELRRRARRHWRARDLHCGAVTSLQRFGSALNLNLHFHTLALDGAYTGIRDLEAPTRFLPMPPPDDDEVARVLAGAARRLQRLLAERAGEDEDALARDEPLLALLAAASLRGRSASGPNAGDRWRRLGDRVDPANGNDDPEASPRVPQLGGMSLHAAVAVPARDRRRLERLCRYVARPPLANERLEELPDGRLALRLKTRWRDGTSHLLMERSELIERLVPLIPPPRAHQVRYHGILAPCASWRDQVVPAGDAAIQVAGCEPEAETKGLIDQSPSAGSRSGPTGLGEDTPGVETSSALNAPYRPTAGGAALAVDPRSADSKPATRHRGGWAELLQRVFGVDALRCPRFGSTMRIIAAIEDPDIAQKILECLNLLGAATIGFLDDAQLVLGRETPALRPLRDFRVRPMAVGLGLRHVAYSPPPCSLISRGRVSHATLAHRVGCPASNSWPHPWGEPAPQMPLDDKRGASERLEIRLRALRRLNRATTPPRPKPGRVTRIRTRSPASTSAVVA
jgi:hypothetical protein